MALKKTVTVNDNFNELVIFTDAYIRVDRIEGSKNTLNITVSVRKPNSTRALYTNSYQFAPSLSGDNFIAQAYGYLKTLPEFAGSIDV